MKLPLIFLERQPPQQDAPAIFLLHGRAAAAKTIHSIEGLLDKQFRVISIQAPFTSQEGQFEWFKPNEAKRTEAADETRYDAPERMLTEQIESMMTERKIDRDKMFLLGFSQGAAMCYLLGLRGKLQPRGVVPMSGFLPAPIRSWPQVSTHSKYLITHGREDNILGSEYSIDAHNFLLSKGIEAEYYEYKGRHKMSLDCVRHVNRWLGGQLSA